jgi:chemotaxis protein methyltransferase CheR
LRLRWAGYRKVRRQVCRRIDRRLVELGLTGVGAYREYLSRHADEWGRLDGLCRVTISRFYRDRGVFDFLGRVVLPHLVGRAGDREVRCWSAGCASGEEPYTLALVWHFTLSRPDVPLSILATDSDDHLLSRAEAAVYGASSLNELPERWRDEAFARDAERFALREPFRGAVRFRRCDVRQEMPEGPFDLILCRNLVFTYFEEALQREVLAGIAWRLRPGGALVVGTHEQPPAGEYGLAPWDDTPAVYTSRGRT